MLLHITLAPIGVGAAGGVGAGRRVGARAVAGASAAGPITVTRHPWFGAGAPIALLGARADGTGKGWWAVGEWAANHLALYHHPPTTPIKSKIIPITPYLLVYRLLVDVYNTQFQCLEIYIH